jgi:hypothetical protein
MTSRPPSRAPLLALVLILAIGVAGCGSGHSTSSGTTPGVGGHGFIAQLGDACRIDVAGIRSAPKTVAGEAPVQRRFIATLRSLKPTPALKPVFAQYLVLLEENLAAFEHHDVSAGKQLRSQTAPVLAKLRHAGVAGC